MFEVTLPGSKSHTHRAMICALLAQGESLLKGWLRSEDTLLTLEAIQDLGALVEETEEGLLVRGTGGRLKVPQKPLFLGNSGTSLRLLTAVSTLSEGEVLLVGEKRLHQRPIGPLTEALRRWGVKVEDREGFPPVLVKGSVPRGGGNWVDCSQSSQFLSALLLIAPYAERESFIEPEGKKVSWPYVLVTLEVMEAFGLRVIEKDGGFFVPKGGFKPTVYHVPPDPSSATYVFLAGAITGRWVKVKGLNPRGFHPDLGFVEVLKRMGCEVVEGEDGVSLRGRDLKGVEVEMGEMPDAVPALAVAAAFAEGETFIKGIGHLRLKESDRIAALEANLRAMGVKVSCAEDSLKIEGQKEIRPCVIDPFGDHRIAMAFAIASLKVEGIRVVDGGCVKKSFPEFWSLFQELKEALCG